ncbi:hypothetical protein KIPB_008183 [Kipferlia bialata]|uniref:Uncharacterized protein n=1 Tax=Kipferlia bialata TaxID=797122 RepID=A0A9K3D312_9EUKA|nr:hypothetical protein KIPB_008183 [Kipferlia bialata]|eukprot:g8183.t1
MGIATAVPCVPDWVWSEAKAKRRFPNLYWYITHEEEYFALPESTRVEFDKLRRAEFAVFIEVQKKAKAHFNMGDKCY